MPVKYTRNPDGTLTQESEGGYRALVIDPDGSFEREMTPPPADAYAAVSAPRPGQPVAGDPLAGMSPEAQAQLAAPAIGAGPVANPVILPDKPPQAPAALPPLEGPKATLTDAPAGGGGPVAPEVTRASTWSNSTGTTGLAKEDKAAVKAAGEKTSASQRAAIDEGLDARGKLAQQHGGQAVASYFDAKAREAGALDAENTYRTALTKAIEERKAARNRPISVADTVAGEKGSYAFAATIGAALANVGRAWMGQAMQPITVIDDIIERGVALQMKQRDQDATAAGETADQAQLQMLSARSDAREAAAQALDAKRALAGSVEEATQLQAWATEMRAKADKDDEDRAMAIATKETTQKASGGSTQVAPGKEAGPAKLTKAAHDDQVNLRQLYRIRDTLRRAEKTGALQGVTGWQDKLGANSVQDFFGGLPPEQREAATALNELEVGNLMRLVREPNNKRTQDMVQGIGSPRNDRDIPSSLSRLDQLIAEQEDAVKNAPAEAPSAAQEVY